MTNRLNNGNDHLNLGFEFNISGTEFFNLVGGSTLGTKFFNPTDDSILTTLSQDDYTAAGSYLIAENAEKRWGPKIGTALYPQADELGLDEHGQETLQETLRLFWDYLENLFGLQKTNENKKPELLTTHDGALKKATRSLKFSHQLLEQLSSAETSIDNLVTTTRDELNNNGAVLISFGRKQSSMFLYITEKTITLFQPDTFGQPHQDIVEQSQDILRKTQRTKVKHQEVLFMKEFDHTILGDDSFFKTLLEISQRSTNAEGNTLATIRNFAYKTLPTLVNGHWAKAEKKALYYKIQRHQPTPSHTTADLFYYLLLDQINSPEEARRTYKLVRYFQKRDQLISSCNRSIDLLQSTFKANITDAIQKEINAFRAINLDRLSRTALKLQQNGDITAEELQNLYATIHHAHFYQKQLANLWSPPELEGRAPPEGLFNQVQTQHNRPDQISSNATTHQVDSFKSSTNNSNNYVGSATYTPHLNENLSLNIPQGLFSEPFQALDDLQKIKQILSNQILSSAKTLFFSRLCEALIKEIPPLIAGGYWSAVTESLKIQPNESPADHDTRTEDLFKMLFETITLLRTAKKYSELFAFNLLHWTLYGIAHRLVQNNYGAAFEKNLFELNAFTAFATPYNNFTLDRDISQKFEQLITLLNPELAIHDPNLFHVEDKEPNPWCPSTIDLKAPHKQDPAAFRFYQHIISKGKTPLENLKICDVLEASAERNPDLDPFHIPLDAKLLQQLIWLVESENNSTMTLWQYRYKPNELKTKDSWGTYFDDWKISIISTEWAILGKTAAEPLVRDLLKNQLTTQLVELSKIIPEDAATFEQRAIAFELQAAQKETEAADLQPQIDNCKQEELKLKQIYDAAHNEFQSKDEEYSSKKNTHDTKEGELKKLRKDFYSLTHYKQLSYLNKKLSSEKQELAAAETARRTAAAKSHDAYPPYEDKKKQRETLEVAAWNARINAQDLRAQATRVRKDRKSLENKAPILQQASEQLKQISPTPKSPHQLRLPIARILEIIGSMDEIKDWNENCENIRNKLNCTLDIINVVLKEISQNLNPRQVNFDTWTDSIALVRGQLNRKEKHLAFSPTTWSSLEQIELANSCTFVRPHTNSLDLFSKWQETNTLLKTAARNALVPEETSTIAQQIQYKGDLPENKAAAMQTQANPRDAINRTIGHHLNRPNDSQDPLIQPWIFFHPGRLEAQLRDNPEFISVMADYFQKIFAQHLKAHRVLDAVHLVQLGLLIKRYVNEIDSKLADQLPPFLNLCLTLQNECSSKMLTPQEVGAVQFTKFIAISTETPERLLQFRQNPNDIDLLATYIAGNSDQLPETPYTDKLIALRMEASKELRNYLRNILFVDVYNFNTQRKDARARILDRAATFFGISELNNQRDWSSDVQRDYSNAAPNDPYCYRAQGVGSYNLTSGQLSITQDKTNSLILNTLIEDGRLAKLLGVNEIKKGREDLITGWVELIYNNQAIYQIHVKQSTFTIQRLDLPSQQPYTLLTNPTEIPTYKALKEFHPEITNPGVRLWAKSTIDFYIETPNRAPREISLSKLPLNTNALNYALIEWARSLGFELRSHTELDADLLSKFKLVKGDLSLSYQVIGDKAYALQYPGYFLSPLHLPNLPQKHIVLENNAGAKKLLIPIEYQEKKLNEKSYEIRTFDIGQNSVDWTPVTLADKFYYATFLTTQGQIEKAHQILEQTSLLKPLSSAEKLHLQTLGEKTANDPVHSQFIALKAAILVMEDLLKYPPLGEHVEFSQQITALAKGIIPIALSHYLIYLQTEAHLRGKNLSELQEIVLLQFITRLCKTALLDQGQNLGPENVSLKTKELLKTILPILLSLLEPVRSVTLDDEESVPPLVLLISHLERRLEALEKGGISVGKSVRNSVSIDMPKLPEFLDGWKLYQEISNHTGLKIEKKTAVETGIRDLIASNTSWIVPELFQEDLSIEQQFATYYKIAQNATPEEFARLKRIYDTTSALFPDKALNKLIATFGELLKHPSAYPKFETLAENVSVIEELRALEHGWRNEDTIFQALKLWYYERDLTVTDKTLLEEMQLLCDSHHMKQLKTLPQQEEFFKQVKEWDINSDPSKGFDADLSIKEDNFLYFYVLATKHAKDAAFIQQLKDYQVAVLHNDRKNIFAKVLGEVLKNPSSYLTIESLKELEKLHHSQFDLLPKEEFFKEIQLWNYSEHSRSYHKSFDDFREISNTTDADEFLRSHSIKTNIAHYYAIATSSDLQKEQREKLQEIQRAGDQRDQYMQFLGNLLKNPKSFPKIESLQNSLNRIELIRWQQKSNEFYGLTFWEKAKLWYLERSFTAFQWTESILRIALMWIRFVGSTIGTIFGILIDRAAIYFAHSVTHLKEALTPAATTMLQFNAAKLPELELAYDEKLTQWSKEFLRTETKKLQFREPFANQDKSDRLKKDLSHLNEYIEQAPKAEYFNNEPRNTPLWNWQDVVLKKHIQEERAELKEKEQKLLEAAAHHLRKKSTSELILEAQTPDADMHTLHLLFLKGSIEAFREKTTLTDDEIQILFNDMALFFRQKSCLNQLETIDQNLTRYRKCADPEEAQILFETFARSLEQRRQYSLTAENRAKLLFEAVQGIMLRKLQVEKIGLILETFLNKGQKTLFEMSTGLGKTKAIAPGSNLETSDGTGLTVNIFPRTLTVTNTLDNAATLEKAGRTADSTIFHRATFMSKETLEYLHRKILSDIENRIPLDGYSETFRAMELHLLSLLMNGTEKPLNEDEEICAELLRKILQVMRTKGFANIDEARDNLNPFDRLIYTRRQRDQLQDYEIEGIQETFTALFENKEILERVRNNTLPEISREEYLNKIAPETADRMADLLRIGYGKTDAEINGEKKLFTDYVLGKTNLYGEDDKETKRWLDAHGKKEAICLVRGLLLIILPDVMKGYVNQNYGFSKKHRENDQGNSKKGFAIPYLSANTPKETELSPSEFQNQHETASKTLVALFHEGLSERQLEEMLHRLIEAYNDNALTGIIDENNNAYKTIQEVFMVEDGEILNVQDLSKNFIGERYKKVRFNQKTIFHYFKYIVASQISLYKQTFVSTSFDFLKQFASSTSMTATPQEAGAHGKDTIFIPTPGSKGFIPYHFFKKGKDILSVDTANYKTLVKSVGKQLLGSTTKQNALIDVGGLFRGHTNRQVVDSLFEQLEEYNSEIEEIAYFDEQLEEFVVVGKNSRTERNFLKDFKGNLSTLLIYFDKARTVGSDTKLGPTASALTLLDRKTTQSEMGQGIGRMRQLQYGQSITFALPEDLYNDLYVNIDGLDLKREILYKHLSVQEDNLEGRGNLLAIKQQINADIRNIVLKKICSASTIIEAQEIFEKDSKELVTTAHFEPSILYGSIISDADVDGDLNRFLERAQERVKQLHCLGFFEKRKQAKMLESYKTLWSAGDKKLTLPEKTISTEEEINGECDVLVEQEVEQQVELEEQLQVTHEHLEQRDLSPWRDEVDLFTPGWEKIQAVGTPLLEKSAIYRFWLRFERKFPKVAIVLKVGTLIGIKVGLCFVAWEISLIVGAIFAAWILYKIGRMVYDKFYPATTPPLFRAQDLARLELGSVADQLFDKDLLLTNNYSNQQPETDLLKAKSISFTPQPLWTYEQKPGFQLLFLVDEDINRVVNDVVIDVSV